MTKYRTDALDFMVSEKSILIPCFSNQSSPWNGTIEHFL